MKLKILALDASSTCTGFSKFLYDETTKNYVFLGTSNIKATDKDIYKRFHTMHTSFVTQGLYEWPDEVVFENYAFNGNRVTQLAELNGVLKYNFTLNDMDNFDSIDGYGACYTFGKYLFSNYDSDFILSMIKDNSVFNDNIGTIISEVNRGNIKKY